MRIFSLQQTKQAADAVIAKLDQPFTPPAVPLFDPVEEKVENLPDTEPPPFVVPHGTNAFYSDLPASTYHSDPCEEPSLSVSIATIIDRQSAAHAHAAHPRYGAQKRTATKALDGGTLIHALILGEEDRIHVVDAKDFKTKKAQEERDQAIAEGLTPIIFADFEEAEGTAKILRQRFADMGIAFDGESEVSAFWTETTDAGAVVQCRGRFDHLAKEPIIYDLKSCRSAHPDACAKHVDAYDYCIQRAAYVRAAEKIRKMPGRGRFVFLFFELVEPFVVTPVELDGAFRELGERRWKRAVEIWARCQREAQWPAYTDRVLQLSPPAWSMARELEREAGEESGAAAEE